MAEPQRHREHRATRPRRNHEDTKTRRHHKDPSIVRRGPHRRAAGDRCAEPLSRTTAFVPAVRPSGLRSRRAQASPLTMFGLGWGLEQSRSSRYECGGTDAPCASDGVKTVWDERSRSEQTGFATGAGDHRIAGVAAAPHRATSPTQGTLLCVLCVFVVATVVHSVSSVTLWFVLYAVSESHGSRLRRRRGRPRSAAP